eukprot:Protomagalhaensia_sp_Gyna_25__801@NODE_1386_length_1889_cov_951_763243_g1115_i0_p1_GENE_NODE_1386_length_1889_cov_951_763243_g1115_i0NODE_1386_length_1889_cov_951_763243_g1115_i0_p1_ORF_typecomplete_len354_score112_43TAL_FSA/PF00923_19/6_4e84_NODE_1386_length_1889_cov_951_763243_g1115_i01161177
MAPEAAPATTMQATEPTTTATHDSLKGNGLDVLKSMTKVVADTGDYSIMKELQPTDATTNPSLLLLAVQQPALSPLVDSAVAKAKAEAGESADLDSLISLMCDHLIVAFGKEILNVIPGVVSIEVDARLSFEKQSSIDRARKIVSIFEKEGISKDRLLIKLASTWEGCEAARVLEAEGIHCNLTLMFCLAQAIAAAEAGAFLISPFVGRILDWHKAASPSSDFSGEKDPGVQSVRGIYSYYKKHGYKTVVMGASFRSAEEIMNLAGCDNLTISPKLMQELAAMPPTAITRKLEPTAAAESCQYTEKISMDEETFRWMLNEDQMATEKLSDGIRKFNQDWDKLKKLLKEKYCSA